MTYLNNFSINLFKILKVFELIYNTFNRIKTISWVSYDRKSKTAVIKYYNVNLLGYILPT